MEGFKLLHPKSSLYITFKVVQLVNQLRKRLKPRVLSSKAKDSEKHVATRFAKDATKGISMLFARSCNGDENRVSKYRNSIRRRPAVLKANDDYAQCKTEVRNSLEELSGAVGEQVGFDIVRTAEDDNRFLRKDVRPVFGHLSWLQAAHNIQLVNAALEILALLRLASDGQAYRAHAKGSQWSADEKTCANLEHLLLCIRSSLMQTFVAKALESVVASAEWQNHWRQHLKFGGDKWCAEFSNNHRPISTTWPWSIRPSLAVLWGVCWMFYPEGQAQDAAGAHGNWWQAMAPQYAGTNATAVANVSQPGQQQLRYNLPTVAASAAHQQAEEVVAGARFVRNWAAAGGSERPAPERHRADHRHRHNFGLAFAHGAHGLTNPGPRQNFLHTLGPRHLDSSSHLPVFPGTPNHPQSTPPSTVQPLWPSSFADTHTQSAHPGTQRGTFAPASAVNHLGQYNRPQDASTRAVNFAPDFAGLVTSAEGSFVNQSTWPLSRPQPGSATASNSFHPAFGHQTHNFGLATNPIGVTGYQAPYSQPQPQRSSFSSSSSPPAHINTEPVRPEDLPAFLTPNPNTGAPYSEYPYYMNTMATDLNSTTDPALTAGEPHELKAQDAVDLAVSATNHPLVEHSAPHGDMSEDPSSPDGIEPFSPRRGFTHKRNEEPPRNEAGKMVCKFQNTCAGLTFDRRCEWSKHMDKHERPYKCTAPGCEKLQGFTYSGGLLRHQREVHKMHGGTKKALYCPEPNCKRNSGTGFTRKENLSEHIRRVHRRATDSVVPYTDGTGMAPIARMHPDAIEQLEAATRDEPDVNDVTDPALTAPTKRKHDEMESHENGLDGVSEVPMLKEEVKRLKADLDARENRLKSLEDEFHKQTALLRQLLGNKADAV